VKEIRFFIILFISRNLKITNLSNFTNKVLRYKFIRRKLKFLL